MGGKKRRVGLTLAEKAEHAKVVEKRAQRAQGPPGPARNQARREIAAAAKHRESNKRAYEKKKAKDLAAHQAAAKARNAAAAAKTAALLAADPGSAAHQAGLASLAAKAGNRKKDMLARQARVAAGRCRDCTEPAEPHKMRCAACLFKAVARWRDKEAAKQLVRRAQLAALCARHPSQGMLLHMPLGMVGKKSAAFDVQGRMVWFQYGA
ncbi:hypothetical protein TSOC_000119 [Tetrabaena socialis]|uniref:Uncharacterized protein n=1 Tax=Tetrabaena socialis TaxID=47790 RepID=A0A2J8AK82_9CHLO|nr:hypothetical protein TSOC_000119 [Tetrabaena socialis]|eukprot:PNH12918.1 hypothetical protein TSOC_000119 [Tetrabaena socialis]